MASITQRLGVDLAKSPNMAKDICDRVVADFASSQAERFSKYAAEDFYSALLEIMSANINQKALDIMSESTGAVSKGGWFEIKNGTTFVVGGEERKFEPTNPTVQGSAFEQLLFGAGVFGAGSTETAYLPDLFKEFLGDLSNVELKAESSSRLTAGKWTLPSSVIKEWVQNSEGDWKPVVDDSVKWAVSVLKVIEKMVSLVVTRTEVDKTKAGMVLFKYLFAHLYAKLRIKELAEAYKKNALLGYLNTPKISVRLEKMPERMADGTYKGVNVSGEISLNIEKAHPTNKGELALYEKKISLWDDDESRKLFFLAMRESERDAHSLSINPEIQKIRQTLRKGQ